MVISKLEIFNGSNNEKYIMEKIKMTIKEATPSDFATMKERLNRRMEERKIEHDIAEVIAIVNGKRNPAQPILASGIYYYNKMGILSRNNKDILVILRY